MEQKFYGYTMHKDLWPGFREELIRRNLYFEPSGYYEWGVHVEVLCTEEEATEIEKAI